MANDHSTALQAANLVSRTSLSLFSFPAPLVNPYANVTGGTNGMADATRRAAAMPERQCDGIQPGFGCVACFRNRASCGA